MAHIDLKQFNHKYIATLVDEDDNVLACKTAPTADEALRLLDDEIIRRNANVRLVNVERGVVKKRAR